MDGGEVGQPQAVLPARSHVPTMPTHKIQNDTSLFVLWMLRALGSTAMAMMGYFCLGGA